ncbi:MAG: SxtJ family membrane protein [Rhodoferax sp.]
MESKNAIEPQMPSDRKFGWFVFVVFGLLALYAIYHGNRNIAVLMSVACIIILAITMVTPGSLSGLNRGWFLLGVYLGRIVSPIVLGVMFFVIITPIAVITRLAGRDSLRLKKNKETRSYWIRRDPKEQRPNSFKDQF